MATATKRPLRKKRASQQPDAYDGPVFGARPLVGFSGFDGGEDFDAAPPQDIIRKAHEAAQQTGRTQQIKDVEGGMVVSCWRNPPFPARELILYYENSSWHKACVEAIAVNVANGQPQPKAKEELPSGRTQADENQKITARNFLASCSPKMPLQEIARAVTTDFKNLGYGAYEIGRNAVTGLPDYVGYIPAHTLYVHNTEPKIQQRIGGRTADFWVYGEPHPADGKNEIFLVKRPNHRSFYYGIPDHLAAIAAIVADLYAREYNRTMFSSRLISPWAITFNGPVSAALKKKIKSYFQRGIQSGEFHTPLLVEGSKDGQVKFDRLDKEIRDASFAILRKLSRDEILAVHRVPPDKIAAFESSRYQTTPEQAEQFRDEVVAPIQQLIAWSFNQILREYGVTDWEAAFPSPDLTEQAYRIDSAQKLAATGAYTINEVRKLTGHKPLPPEMGGDNLMGQPAAPGMGVPGQPGAPTGDPIQDILNQLTGQPAGVAGNGGGAQRPQATDPIQSVLDSLVSKALGNRLGELETKISKAIGATEP